VHHGADEGGHERHGNLGFFELTQQVHAMKPPRTVGLMREDVDGTATWALPSETVMREGSSFGGVGACTARTAPDTA